METNFINDEYNFVRAALHSKLIHKYFVNRLASPMVR